MSNTKSVTEAEKSVTEQRDTLARARPSFGGDVTLSRCHVRRDVTSGERDSDMHPCRGARHHHETQRSYASKPMTALHIAALNTLQDYEAGIAVPAHRLEAACKLLGRTTLAPARVSTPEAA